MMLLQCVLQQYIISSVEFIEVFILTVEMEIFCTTKLYFGSFSYVAIVFLLLNIGLYIIGEIFGAVINCDPGLWEAAVV